MKKILISFLLLVAFTVTSFSQTAEKVINQTVQTVLKTESNDSVKTVVTDSATLTMLRVYEDTKAGIYGLASALKAPVEHVYEVLVKQQVIYSFSYLLIDLFLLAIALFLLIKFGDNLKRTRNPDDNWYGNEIAERFELIGILMFGGLFSIISIITIISTLSAIITGFFNPEYGALQDVVNFIK